MNNPINNNNAAEAALSRGKDPLEWTLDNRNPKLALPQRRQSVYSPDFQDPGRGKGAAGAPSSGAYSRDAGAAEAYNEKPETKGD